MKVNEFNKVYEYAKTIKVVEEDWFQCNGWFWINLTSRQHKKMYLLMLEQGAEEGVNQRGVNFIQLGNGIQIFKTF